ncbi:MAG: M1 family metallopeptidase [Candidatus Woesearchaeota archaeon]
MNKIKPLNYKLTFEPDLEKFTFDGIVELLLKTNPTNKIILNSADLEIKKAEIIYKSNKLEPKIKINNENEELILTLPKKVSGKIVIKINFKGILNDQLVGFYRSKYYIYDEKTNSKIEKYMATTQFEAADARRAFPCIDHPNYKATFDITIITKENETAISNMPMKEIKTIILERENEKKEIIKETKKAHIFETTPIMSTYLVYLSAGNFEWIEDKVKNKIGNKEKETLIRVITTPGKKEQGYYALELGKKFLKYYEDYFQIPYPLPKMDLIAIADFAAGAMENWGAITFRENALLFDPKISSTATKQRIAEIIAHEIAHQWFGNLVTMKWWNDLWLNESFATYMATKAVADVFPEFDFWDQFLSDSTESAMRIDSLKSSHPIEAKVKTPKEIAEIFDDISYDKGGSILRMLNHYIGEKHFIEGIKYYLKKYKYSNTESIDLWNSWEKVSKKPIKKFLKNWIKKTGYPLVIADEKVKKTKQKQKEFIILKQKRFLLEKQNSKDKWLIPVRINFIEKNTKKDILLNKEAKIEKISPYLINEGYYGFYRVKYNSKNLNYLKTKLNNFSNIDRWALQNDLYALAKSGEIKTKEYLDFITNYYGEIDFLVCSDILDNLGSIYYLTYYETFNKTISEFIKKFLYESFKKLTWDKQNNEKHTTPMLRAKVISFLGKLENQEIIEEAKKRFNSYLKNNLDPDLQMPVFNILAWNENSELLYNKFLDFYRNAKTQEEKVRFLLALTSFKDEKLLKKTFDFMLSDEIRFSDILYPASGLAGNPIAKKMLWPFIKENWTELDKRLGETKMLLRRVVSNLAVLSDSESEKDIDEFFKKRPKGLEMTLAQVLEKIRINKKHLERMKAEFK